ncbi:MAG: HAMP domain-containing sensor histidine kinase [Bacteroidales bacterium]|nr:HAMP domain-containing sensor histidine kinase [Bacteroidales bacterium]
MNIYLQKRQWKVMLVIAALLIVVTSLWYTNQFAKNLALEERQKVKLWAEAIQKKASLVKYTEELFNKIKDDERVKVEIWAEAMHRLLKEENTKDLTFYINIISSNKNIPIILTDKNDIVSSSINLNFKINQNKKIPDSIKKEFSKYPPIQVRYRKQTLSLLYYKDSKLFADLQNVMNDLIKTFISEVVINSASVPVIFTDSTQTKVIASGNINPGKIKNKEYVLQKLSTMASQNKPIEVQLSGKTKNYIFWEDSFLLRQLRYYPYVLFFIIGLFLLVSYFIFSNVRKAEQNKVWVGMAKETAHQLGTPLSSLIAWIEYLKLKNVEQSIITELAKDVKQLEIVTERFSKIGSEPKLEETNITKTLNECINYMKLRVSEKIKFSVITYDNDVCVPLNMHLFNWVIENLFKNAVDAIGDNAGNIDIIITSENKLINIDITDSGKGVQKSKFKTIFKPGYTSKQRGWGLGLSLSKRIIEQYHNGKIFVKNSSINKGATFRIVLRKKV